MTAKRTSDYHLMRNVQFCFLPDTLGRLQCRTLLQSCLHLFAAKKNTARCAETCSMDLRCFEPELGFKTFHLFKGSLAPKRRFSSFSWPVR